MLSSTERLAAAALGLGDAWPGVELLEDAVEEDDMDEDMEDDMEDDIEDDMGEDIDEDVMDGEVLAVVVSVVVVTLELVEAEVVMIGPPGLILSEVVLVAVAP